MAVAYLERMCDRLGDEALGLADRIEVWSRAEWERERSEAERDSAELAEHLAGGGGNA